MSDENENRIYTSSKGVVLKLRPISQFKLDNLRASRKEIPVPTYTVKPVVGPEQEFPLDEEVATSRGRLDEWKEYREKCAKEEADYSKKFSLLIMWDGVSVEAPGQDSEWQATSDFLGIALPTNPIERKAQYIYDELLGAPGDLGELIAGVLDVSQMDQEVVERLRATFRTGAGRKTHSGMAAQKVPVEVEEPIV